MTHIHKKREADIIIIIISIIIIRLLIVAVILEHLRTFNVVNNEHCLTLLTMNLT